jgi:hypothetical protein
LLGFRPRGSTLTPLLLLLSALAAPTLEIEVDQVGYLSDGQRVAFVVSKTSDRLPGDE